MRRRVFDVLTSAVGLLYGSIASFILALIMLGFLALGLRHAHRTPAEDELMP